MAILKEPLSPDVRVYETPPKPGVLTRQFLLAKGDFYSAPADAKKTDAPYLLIGFDTEFQGPGYAVSREEIKAGKARYRVLSYQFHAKTSDGAHEWSGICCPEDGTDEARISMGQLIGFALASGARDHAVTNLPTTIYLVGHFTRADIPAFRDFRSQAAYLSSLRSTIVTVDKAKPYVITFPDSQAVELSVRIRDTMLLTPQMSRSLAEIGKLVGVEKLSLDPDPKAHKWKIRHMQSVRENEWENFKRYAVNDAVVCVRYIERIIEQYRTVTGKKKVPVTLTSIGVDLLLKSLKERFGNEALDVLGKEVVVEKYYDKTRGFYVKTRTEVDLPEVALYYPFGNEAYHGGRNEQFWFGPCFEDEWTDYDLSSAYPTAMSLIRRPKWKEMRHTTKLEDFTADTLGFASVQFEFPESVRYPTLPVRTSHGLVFPLSGISFCASPEIALAKSLGARLTVIRGVVIPTDKDTYVFGPFTRECLEYRKAAGSRTLTGLFWKEISNSTYGKTAQGLRDKRVYDMRDRKTNPLPPSRITNPFFAAYITSYVRAVLGEVMNAIKEPKMVFSCTTDGFITNATTEEINAALQGELARTFATARRDLTGDPRVIEVKHRIRQPLGWRTRGQATLKPGNEKDEGQNIVLAKAGIYTPPQYETDEDENEYIVELFFDRTPERVIELEGVLTGIRDIVENEADLVEKYVTKRLNMEFDWKRRPLGVGVSPASGHVVFSTQPWRTVEQFTKIRDAWDQYTSEEKVCVKDLEDFERFARYIETKAALPQEVRRYMRSDLMRLRQMLCTAWHEEKAGFKPAHKKLRAHGFAQTLASVGVPCTQTDVENARKRVYLPHFCSPTEAVKDALRKLKTVFKSLDVSEFLCVDTSPHSISIKPTVKDCPNVTRCSQSSLADPLALPKAA